MRSVASEQRSSFLALESVILSLPFFARLPCLGLEYLHRPREAAYFRTTSQQIP